MAAYAADPELLEGIALLFVEAGRRHDSMSIEAWVVAAEERRNAASAERMLWNYHHVVKKDPVKYEHKLAVAREASRRWKAKRRAERGPSTRYLTPEQRNEIVRLSLTGLSERKIAKQIGCSHVTVHKTIVKYRSSEMQSVAE